ncbi:MAG TPA: hypothetical protein VG820_01840 [Fimbriimonadaceae bacterium]|nr:hypothetical protein [Fimbriimonadaceae bacterium]
MAKKDRIPDQWPGLMCDELSARYLSMSVSMFRHLVNTGKIPKGRRVFDTTMIRWRRETLDAVRDQIGGLPLANPANAVGADDEWMAAINAN